jgi:hypothetical protein
LKLIPQDGSKVKEGKKLQQILPILYFVISLLSSIAMLIKSILKLMLTGTLAAYASGRLVFSVTHYLAQLA